MNWEARGRSLPCERSVGPALDLRRDAARVEVQAGGLWEAAERRPAPARASRAACMSAAEAYRQNWLTSYFGSKEG